jgi:hypothetical protein
MRRRGWRRFKRRAEDNRYTSSMSSPPRDLTGGQARQLIDDILNRTVDDFVLHLSWKEKGAMDKIEQHLSFHGTWTSDEILATGKGRNQQIEEVIMRSLKKG